MSYSTDCAKVPPFTQKYGDVCEEKRASRKLTFSFARNSTQAYEVYQIPRGGKPAEKHVTTRKSA